MSLPTTGLEEQQLLRRYLWFNREEWDGDRGKVLSG